MSAEMSIIQLSELSAAFESIADGQPNSLLIYKAAKLIYELTNDNDGVTVTSHSSVGGSSNTSPSTILNLNRSFYSLLASTDDDYLSNVILKDLNEGLVGLTQNANETLQEMTTTMGMGNRSKQPEHKQRLEQDLSKCFTAMKAFHTIFTISDEDQKEPPRCCRLGFREEVCSQIVFLYDAACQCNAPMKLKECILQILHSMVLHGLIIPSASASASASASNKHGTSEDDTIQSIMKVIQDMSSEQSSTCLGDLVAWQKQKRQNSNNANILSIEESINLSFGDQVHTQKEYLLLMLSSAKTSTDMSAKQSSYMTRKMGKSTTSQNNKPSARGSKKGSQKSGMERMIEQIKQLFPNYGDGYVEAALACYNNDVEETTSALLEAEINPNSNLVHPRLRALDKKLPSRRKESKSQYNLPSAGAGSDIDDDEVEAMEIQKARLREMEVQEENEAYLLSAAMGEYNDEYDDQYDGIGDDGGAAGGIGGADSGLYDMPDFEAIKAYNKAAKEMEADRLFWEDSRNTNRRKGNDKSKKDDDSGSDGDDPDRKVNDNSGGSNTKKYRGPDKGRGGRIVGPDGKYLPFPKGRKKGGGGGGSGGSGGRMKQQQGGGSEGTGAGGGGNESNKSNDKNQSTQMSKIQKRRKNDNKAKIANHHRKERAMKKGAM